MGLDIDSADGHVTLFRGGYGGFMRFRNAVAQALGYNGVQDDVRDTIFEMMGTFDGKPLTMKEKLQRHRRSPDLYPDPRIKRLTAYDVDPRLGRFLAHSDCDGEWSVKECKEVKALLCDALTKVDKDKMDYLNKLWAPKPKSSKKETLKRKKEEEASKVKAKVKKSKVESSESSNNPKEGEDDNKDDDDEEEGEDKDDNEWQETELTIMLEGLHYCITNNQKATFH